MTAKPKPILILACGALAREIKQLMAGFAPGTIEFACLPAQLHNQPERIASAVDEKLAACASHYRQIFVAYADCGTGGDLDRVLKTWGVTRLAGPHCYATFAGQDQFAAIAEAEIGSFYLTDFLVRQFETLVIKGLGLDRHPELQSLYFAHYRRLVYLAQTDDSALDEQAKQAATRLGLDYQRIICGYGELASFVAQAVEGETSGQQNHHLLAGHSSPSDDQGRAKDGQEAAGSTLRTSHRSRRHARRPDRNRRLSRTMETR